ncbi:hypothetical protein [Leuconostoc mesenteroides]|uniref:hypothetical protein n=1 Tax=Leuconostoc mesenteroides TaxID=1245 RepID=UPI00235F02E8|nr:hypothetical protein [Leuconostoc mesenteroides]
MNNYYVEIKEHVGNAYYVHDSIVKGNSKTDALTKYIKTLEFDSEFSFELKITVKQMGVIE